MKELLKKVIMVSEPEKAEDYPSESESYRKLSLISWVVALSWSPEAVAIAVVEDGKGFLAGQKKMF